MAATEATLRLIFGDPSITAWADPDGTNNSSKIAARINWALATATAHVYEYLRALHYRVPPVDPDTGQVPITVEYAASLYAGLLLYAAYSMYENMDRQTPGIEKLAWFKDELTKILAEWRSGVRNLSAVSARL